MEIEYYSKCCSAPPLYDIGVTDNYEFIGYCMKCRDYSKFKLGEINGES